MPQEQPKTQAPTQAPPGPPPTFVQKVWRGWVKPILPVVIVLVAFRSTVADWNDVPTGSMKPTILEGERIIVNKLAYDLRVPLAGWSLWRFEGPARGEIVVFFSPDKDIRMVKRIVALPGETVEVREGRLIVNGEPLSYTDAAEDTMGWLSETEQARSAPLIEKLGDHTHPVLSRSDVSRSLHDYGPAQVPEGKYFLMGDNRDNSADSRVWGFVERDRIRGRATRVAVSVDTDRWWPRWGRFFQKLE